MVGRRSSRADSAAANKGMLRPIELFMIKVIEPLQLRLANHMPAATPDPKPRAKKPIWAAYDTSFQNTTENAAAMTKNINDTPIILLFFFNGIPSYKATSSVKRYASLLLRRPPTLSCRRLVFVSRRCCVPCSAKILVFFQDSCEWLGCSISSQI